MPTPPVPGLKVLIAEDDGPLGRLYAAVLSSEGHEVDLARDSTTALSMIDRNAYGLILLDLTIGRTGVSICSSARAGACPGPWS